MPLQLKDTLRKCAALYGVVWGPVSHSGLGPDFLRIGTGPQLPTDDATLRMKNTECSLALAGERVQRLKSQRFDYLDPG